MWLKKVSLAILLMTFIFIADTRADTLYLKNGRRIEGLIKSEDDDSVELEISSGTVKFNKSDIEKIERTAPGESDTIRQQLEKERQEARQRYEQQSQKEKSRPREVEFSRDALGITVRAILDKKVEATLVLDTGASLVMLTRSVAQKLGLNLERVRPDMQLQMADGRKVKGKRIILGSVKVQNVEATNVEAAVLLEEAGNIGFGDGLLGMSFLRQFNFKIDQKEKKLILEKL